MDTIERDAYRSLVIEPESSAPKTTEAPRKRRNYSNTFKRQIVEETLAGRSSVSVVARRHDVNANQLFRWRKQYHAGLLPLESDPHALIPVAVQDSSTLEPTKNSAVKAVGDAGRLEITLTGRHRLVVTGTVCPSTLRTALTVLSSC